jgi:hypothetical protein
MARMKQKTNKKMSSNMVPRLSPITVSTSVPDSTIVDTLKMLAIG